MFKELSLVNYIDISICFVLGLLISILLSKSTKKYGYVLFFIFAYIITCILFFLHFDVSSYMLGFALFTTLIFFLVSNESLIFRFFRLSNKTNRNVGNDIEEEFYNEINDAVISLSKDKTGALLTFEKDEDLSDYIQKGKPIDCKVNSDILRTIFYSGTPLHDGAVIIRKNIIEAASVYYTPTTKAMPGKFGARHRAAIGFSETHSSVTIIVSEETGRISFAVNGELIPATHETFKKRFMDILKK